MKGLILKDLYSLKGFQKQYLFIIFFMIAWMIMFKNTSFVSIYIVVMGGTILLSTLNMDEGVRFNRFALTMPVSVEKLILAKYLFLVMIIGAGTGISLLFNWITGVLFTDMTQVYAMDWQSILTTAMVFVLGYAVVLPASLRYGVEKGRNVYICTMLLFGGAVIGLVRIGGKSSMMDIDTLLTEKIALVTIFLVILCVVVLMISYLICIKLVKKKEW